MSTVRCSHCGRISYPPGYTEYVAEVMGRLGGRKTAKRGKAYYSRIGKLGMAKRWGKKRTNLT